MEVQEHQTEVQRIKGKVLRIRSTKYIKGKGH